MNPRRAPRKSLLAAMSCLLIAACSPPTSPPAPASASAPTGYAEPLRIPETRAPLPDDPARDGWRSEVLAAAVASRLKELAAAIADDATDVSTLATDSFRVAAVVAARPTVVHESGAFLVEDLLAAPEESRELGTGGDGVERLCASLARACGEKPMARAKVVGIEVDGDRCASRVLLSISAGRRQLEGEATATWIVEKDEPGLSSFVFHRLRRTAARGPIFTDVTRDALAGADRASEQLARDTGYWLTRIPAADGVDILGHCGIAVGDHDGDGIEDVHVSQPGGLPNRLLRGLPDGRFEDVSAEAGVDILDRTTCALFADLDNDGDQDLTIATRAGLAVMANEGDGAYRSAAHLGSPSAWSLTASDFDGDGDLDLYASAYFGDALAADGFPSPNPFHDAVNGGRNVLWRNDGDWVFADATAASGLDVDNTRFTFAASWTDHDDDGDDDLMVVNDFGSNKLYRNDGGRFTDVTARAGVDDRNFGMSITWGDHDRDGREDAYVSNMYSSAGNRIVPQSAFKPGADEDLRSRFLGMAAGNTLLRNSGDGTFRDVTREQGAGMARWAWGARFADVDNDGWQDLLVCNGYVSAAGPGDL